MTPEIPRPYGYVKRVWKVQRARPHDHWQVWARMRDGKARCTSFSVEKHGSKKAKRMARERLGEWVK